MPSFRSFAGRSRPGRAGEWLLGGCATGAGALLGLTFPPFDLPWPLLILAVAIWFALTDGLDRRATMWRSLWFALGFQLVLLRWLVVVGLDAWIALSLLESLFFIPVALIRSRPLGRCASIALTAVVWPAMDWIRDHAGPLAFGWGQLAFAKVDAPWSVLAPLTSQELVTAAIVLLAGLLTLARGSGLGVSCVAVGSVILALSAPHLTASAPTTATSGARLALVQAGVDRTGLGAFGNRRVVMKRNAALTSRMLSNSNLDLIIWPENAVDVDPYTDPTARDILRQTASDTGVPILFGALLRASDGRRNVAMVVDSHGMRTMYTKQRLVPFGEVLPARELLSRYFKRTKHLPTDFVGGTDPGHLMFGDLRLGLVICFEIADESIVRAATSNGARALIVQTNNATYAGLGQSEQQLRIAQFRALSLGLPVYVVSTTGPSALIATDGHVVQQLDENQMGILLTGLPSS